MADSILRLKVDSQEYDAKIKRAAEGIQQMAKRAHDMQGEFAGLDDSQKEFIKNLQYMTTVSASVTGQARELETAYKQLQSLYNSFTGFEKNSEEGKLLAQQLSILRQRTLDAKSAVSDANKSLENEGGILESLTSKFTFNIDALKVFDTAMSAVTSVLDIAKDAFFQSETNVDDWGRTVAASEGVYNSFCLALNSGDFSSFLNNMDNVIAKSIDAYNAIDELKTLMTIINPERAKIQAQVTEQKAIIRRYGQNSEEGRAAQSRIRQLEKPLTEAYNREGQMNYTAFRALVDQRLAEAGLKLEKRTYNLLMESFSNSHYYDVIKKHAKGRSGAVTNKLGQILYYEDTRNTEQKILDLFTDEWRTNNSQFLTASFNARNAAQSVLLSDSRYVKNGGTGGRNSSGGGSRPSARATAVKVEEILPVGSIAEYTARIRELQTAQSLVTDTSSWKELQGEITHVTYLIKRLKGEVTVEKTVQAYSGPSLQDNISQQLKDLSKLNETATNGPKKEGDDTTEAWENAANAINAAGSALQSLREPSIKVAGIVGQAVANIALGFSKQSLAAAGGGPWAWIAAIAGGLGTMVSTIAAIKSATKGYSTGGRIEGNSYSGDNLLMPLNSGGYASLNAGEIVLNRAQTNNLANALTPQSTSNYGGAPYLTGELIFLGANNHLGRTGQGEIVTTSMLRSYGLIG